MDVATDVVREVFGFDNFRAGQAEAIGAAMRGDDAAVLLPTGAGKSLCFQVPAIARARLGHGPTLVVSPLIALMADQVDALRGRGVRAGALNSHLSAGDARQMISDYEEGEIELLYVSPERAAQDGFRRTLKRRRPGFVAIDEAHCVSQWGHDFRPEYMQLAELREFSDGPMMAVTATATPRVLKELVKRLGLESPHVVRGDFRRPNLSFGVELIAKHDVRTARLIELLDAAGLRGRTVGGKAIIYCSTRKHTEKVASDLASAGFSSRHYHAGRTKIQREKAQHAFAAGRVRVLVATSAFGMGIDFPDVRLVAHFQSPGSLEAYYQEAGRAGRDNEPARCVL
ncbi:MAG: ATP-dependent DNA helicase RecQ, partial [Polyangiales bacterium]